MAKIKKFFYFMLGVLLLPSLWALVRALVGGRFFGGGKNLLALVGGIALFVLVYFLLPRRSRPTRAYVLAHELTHALFGWLDGARIGRIRVAKESGSVMLSKTSLLTLLAPYFFPFYTVILIVLVGITACFVSLAPYRLWIYGLIGVTWGFHLCFTLSTLLQHQTDISRSGYLFSYVAILYLNLVVLTCGLLVATPASGLDFLRHWWDMNLRTYLGLWHLFV